jgi:hypothetical protein
VQEVYSKPLASTVLTTAAQVLYTVAAGQVAVIRDMTIGWGVTAGTPGDVTVQLGGTNSRIWVSRVTVNGTGSDHWSGYLVLGPGEQVRALTPLTGTVWLTVSGYELSSV